MNVFNASPFYRLTNKERHTKMIEERKEDKIENILPLKKYALSRDYIFLVTWLSIANINVYFLVYTWGQYTRFVDGKSYQDLVYLFGDFAWVGAVFCVGVGAAIDLISTRLRNKYDMNTGKAIGALIFAIFSIMIGLAMNGVQMVATTYAAMSAVFIFNLYRAWTYGLPPVYIKSRYPNEYFGRLVGILRLVAGVTSAVIIALTEVPKENPETGFQTVFVGLIISVVFTFSFPINGFVEILSKN